MSPAGRPQAFPVKKVIAFDNSMIAAVDNWRRRQPDLPNFSEAIRRLVDLGLAATGSGKAPVEAANAAHGPDSKPARGEARSFSKADQVSKSPRGTR